MSYQRILVDDPRPRVRRITLNRPEKRRSPAPANDRAM
jgi:enoyl-CoA hydratase